VVKKPGTYTSRVFYAHEKEKDDTIVTSYCPTKKQNGCGLSIKIKTTTRESIPIAS
jgi:hypothetical protein